MSGSATAKYDFALFESTTATTVGRGLTNAETGYFPGTTTYAFEDPSWTLVDYGVNLPPVGRFIGNEQLINGFTAVPGVAAGTTAQFVVVGWSDNLGSTLIELEASLVNPGFNTVSFLGESAVSGPINLGDNVNSPAAILFSMNGYPYLQGFTLGEIAPEPAALAVATMGGLIWLAVRLNKA